ncbi:MAG: thioredoxin family protein [Leptospiraceae bacterium]|nr:thioredoxin family protein [Leptospiraceae bacterium]MCP5501496.1 thioredoxin family protein [Leptospiraceae bacterium]
MTRIIFLLFFIFSFSGLGAESLIDSLNHFVEKELSAESNSFYSFLLLFLGGFAASLLPCTYPLYPITLGIIRQRAEGNSNYTHPSLYYIGLAFIYMIFGFIAGISGGAFNTILRYPQTNLLIAFLIFLMGLSSLELLYIPFFTQRQVNAGNKGLGGTFLLGMAAGLLSSPCVGPVVVTVLLAITTSIKTFSIGLIFLTAFKMLIFGAGVGFIFLLIGIFGLSLPRSGNWLKYIQIILGLVVILFSYSYYEKAIKGFGLDEKTGIQVLLSFLIILLSAYSLQSEEKQKHEKMRGALAVSTLITASLILFISFLPRQLVKTTENSGISKTRTETEKENVEMHGNLKWYRDKEQAYREAKRSGKKLFIDFYADWCTNCKAFQKLSLSDETLNKALQTAVLYKVMDTDKIFDTYAEDPKFPELQIGLPFFLIFDSEGKELIYKTTNYLNTKEMIESLR